MKCPPMTETHRRASLASTKRRVKMRRLALTVPEVAFIAATRGALGFGIGLLLSSKFDESRRRTVGWSLFALGLATTIPAARRVFGTHSVVTVAS
jgi:hypothetical protein